MGNVDMMSNNQVNVTSKFHAVFTRIGDIKYTLQQRGQGEIAMQLGEVNNSLRIIEGNKEK